MCENKKLFDLNVVAIHLLQQKKKFMENACVSLHMENHVFYKIMVKRIVGSTSSSNNVYGVINDNSNHYRSIIMDTM